MLSTIKKIKLGLVILSVIVPAVLSQKDRITALFSKDTSPPEPSSSPDTARHIPIT